MFGSGYDDGAKPEEWTSRYGLFHPDERTPFELEDLPLWKALKGMEMRDVGMFVRNPRVSEGRHVSCTCLPVRDEQGEMLGVMTLVRDINSQRRMEEEKRRTEQHFRVLVETAQEGIWTIDEQWRTTYVNKYMANLLGYRPEEIVGQRLESFLDAEAQSDAHKHLDRKGEAPAGSVRDFSSCARTGPPSGRASPPLRSSMSVGKYIGSLAMITDITQRRAAEEQMRQLNAQLEKPHRRPHRAARVLQPRAGGLRLHRGP